jgi:hypothetical protein
VIALPASHPAHAVSRDYLVFEQRCLKWYPISTFYFTAEAEALAAVVAQEPSSAGECQEPEPAAPAAKKGRGRPRKKKPKTVAQPDQPESALALYLRQKLEALQQEVFGMPSGHDDAVPESFKAAAPPGYVDCIEIIDE